MQPAQYWRRNKEWKTWLGRKGTVIASTLITVAAPDQAELSPYSYVLVDFGDQKKEFMGVGHQKFTAGEEVRCVLRKIGNTNSSSLIEYGIKVQKIS